MNVVKYNKVLANLKDQPTICQLFKWAHTSPEAKKFDELGEEFLGRLKMVQEQAAIGKRELKKKKGEKLLKIIEECKLHNGPVTTHNLSLLENLTEKQARAEVQFLKATTAPHLRLSKRTPVNPQTKKFKVVSLDLEELRMQIRSVLKPSGGKQKSFAELKSMIKF